MCRNLSAFKQLYADRTWLQILTQVLTQKSTFQPFGIMTRHEICFLKLFFFLEEIKPTPHDARAREELKLIREAFQFLLYTVSTEVTTQNVVIFGHDSKHSDQSAACYSGRPVWNKSSNIFEMIKRKKRKRKERKVAQSSFALITLQELKDHEAQAHSLHTV